MVQTLIPLTIRQLYNAKQSHPDDVFRIDNKELNQITFVGQIVSVRVESMNVELEVDDGTSKISVGIWLDAQQDSSDYLAEKQAAWREGVYVRVIGNLRSFNNQRSVGAFRIQLVEDFNEITYHFLEVIQVHLHNTRGPLPQETSKTTQKSSGNAHGWRPGSGLTELQAAVLEIIQTSPSHQTTQGVSVAEIYQNCKQLAEMNDIKDAISFLHSEATIYTTVDESHFKVAKDNA